MSAPTLSIEGSWSGVSTPIHGLAVVPIVSSTRPESFFLCIQEFDIGNGMTLHRRTPLVIRAELEEGCYVADVPELSISPVAFNQEEMKESVEALLAVMWQEYALEEDEQKLHPAALDLKCHLLAEYEAR